MRNRLATSALALWATGCTGQTTDREVRKAWLVDAIADDNRIWMSREGSLLEAKYAKMALDPYNYMRGTAGVAFRDWSRPTGNRQSTQFGGDSEASTILITGDPHPENIGTYLPGAGIEPTGLEPPLRLYLECTDFDGAGYGPWVLDTRRALLGLGVLLDASDCDEACQDRVFATWAEAYVDELERHRTTDHPFDPSMSGAGDGIADALVAEAIEEGLLRKRILEWTEPARVERRFRVASGLDRTGSGTLALTASEAAQLDRLLARWDEPRSFRFLDAARHFGQGVSSVPAIRYVVLFDRGREGLEDDALVGFREVVDPSEIPGLVQGLDLRWDTNAQRIVETARTLWTRPDADGFLAAVTDGDLTFKIVTASSFNEGFAHERIAEHTLAVPDPEADLTDFADTLARQLASTHARGHTRSGGPALDAILADLDGSGSRFTSEASRTARADLDQTLIDYQLFVEALDELGPLLGADRLGVQ